MARGGNQLAEEVFHEEKNRPALNILHLHGAQRLWTRCGTASSRPPTIQLISITTRVAQYPVVATSPAFRGGTGRRLWIAVPIVAVLVYSAALLGEYRGGRVIPGRWLSDHYDTGVYWEHAQFYPAGGRPYVDSFSEYPVISTLAFAVPLVVSPNLDRRTYHYVWGWLMTLPFIATLLVINGRRRDANLRLWPMACMASPTLLCFSLNRFDILPALVCALSLRAFHKERYAAAHLLLAIGVHLKWYPAVIFPVYLAYHMQVDGLYSNRLRGFLHSRSLKYGLVFASTVLALALLTILAVGWDGFIAPYRFHAARGGQYFNPYWLTIWFLERTGWIGPFVTLTVDALFLAAQLSIAWLLLAKRISTHDDVDRYAVLAVVIFVTFAKIDSPQWILWYAPLGLMFASMAETVPTE